jgi:poly(A) polymerase
MLNLKINREIALTGEIDLHGFISKIGGVRYKVQGGFKAGIKKIFLPLENKEDLEKLQKEMDMDHLPALEKAMSHVLAEQCQFIMIPKRHTQMIREIWLLQFRFQKRTGTRAYQMLEHPRFRAAYDLLSLRALAGDESIELAEWWTTFQEVDLEQKDLLIKALTTKSSHKKNKKN